MSPPSVEYYLQTDASKHKSHKNNQGFAIFSSLLSSLSIVTRAEYLENIYSIYLCIQKHSLSSWVCSEC